jgi:hypothetical protein
MIETSREQRWGGDEGRFETWIVQNMGEKRITGYDSSEGRE